MVEAEEGAVLRSCKLAHLSRWHFIEVTYLQHHPAEVEEVVVEGQAWPKNELVMAQTNGYTDIFSKNSRICVFREIC